MEVDGGGEDGNPSSNGGQERSRSSNGGSDHHHGLNQKKKEEEKEGRFLLGSPTFSDLGNGRLRCVETGHELFSKDRESYALSKGCRLALIEAALSQKKPPLNMFQPHPLSKSKLVCELTGDTINKSEEHIWKHISGKRFQNKLEQMEVEKLASTEKVEKNTKQASQLSKPRIVTVKKDQKQDVAENGSLEKKSKEHGSDSEDLDFWIPPTGSRWDFDDGRDRWESCENSGPETDDDIGSGADEKGTTESVELSMQTKRMSIAVGPSSYASRKKKIKRTPPSTPVDD